MHRFLWDMHYAPITGVEPEYPMTAIYRDTPPAPTSPWVMPGDYTVVLTVNGKSYTQPLTVKMDPRVKISAAELQTQFELSRQLSEVRATLEPIGKTFDSLVEQLTKLKEQSLPKNVEDKLNALNSKIKELVLPIRDPVRRLRCTRSIQRRVCSNRSRALTLHPPTALKPPSATCGSRQLH